MLISLYLLAAYAMGTLVHSYESTDNTWSERLSSALCGLLWLPIVIIAICLDLKRLLWKPRQ